jgi:hypothetical protein
MIESCDMASLTAIGSSSKPQEVARRNFVDSKIKVLLTIVDLAVRMDELEC